MPFWSARDRCVGVVLAAAFTVREAQVNWSTVNTSGPTMG